MTIIIHFDNAGHPSWLTAPFNGSGVCVRNTTAPPPQDGLQVIATAWITLTTIKDAIYRVSEETALVNLGRLGCDVQVTPNFRQRKSDR